MSRSFVPTDIAARLHPHVSRPGRTAAPEDYIVVCLFPTLLDTRFAAMKLVPEISVHGTELAVGAADGIIGGLQPAFVHATPRALTAVFPPAADVGSRPYKGHLPTMLAVAASGAASGCLAQASTSVPEFVRANPALYMSYTGHAITLPTQQLARDFVILREIEHETRVTCAFAAADGLQMASTARLRQRLERTNMAWNGLSSSQRFGARLKALPSAEAGIWETVDLSAVYPCARELEAADQLGRLIDVRYTRVERMQLAAGEIPSLS